MPLNVDGNIFKAKSKYFYFNRFFPSQIKTNQGITNIFGISDCFEHLITWMNKSHFRLRLLFIGTYSISGLKEH